MKTAKEILTAIEGQQIYVTTRGTVGDADGVTTVDCNLIDNFEFAEVTELYELIDINFKAYRDCMDYWQHDPALSLCSIDDFYVIYQDDQYLLVWED